LAFKDIHPAAPALIDYSKKAHRYLVFRTVRAYGIAGKMLALVPKLATEHGCAPTVMQMEVYRVVIKP
jgi:hypothetical protein